MTKNVQTAMVIRVDNPHQREPNPYLTQEELRDPRRDQ